MTGLRSPGTTARALLVRLLLFSVLWWVLVEGDLRYPVLGTLMVLASVGVSLALWPIGGWRWRPLRLPGFLGFFLVQSTRGGLDIARRAFAPSLPLESHLIHFRLRLEDEAARVFFAWVIGLVPGTASARLRGDRMRIHLIGDPERIEPMLRDVESRIARLFGADLAS